MGRTGLLDALQRDLSDALEGLGAVRFVTGDPGMGKTRTALELARRARRVGARVLWGSCGESSESLAYEPWRHVMRELLLFGPDVVAGDADAIERLASGRPRLDPGADARSIASRGLALEAVASVIGRATARVPLLLVLEDLHRADPPSLELLQIVCERASHSALLVLGTYRPGEAGAAVAAIAGNATRHELVGLSAGEVEEFVAELTGERAPSDACRALAERTGGNPLYLLHLVRSAGWTDQLPGALPSSVQSLVAQSLSRLSPECRDVLRCASVFGRVFELRPLAQALALPDERALAQLDEAQSARLVSDGATGSAFAFAHGLVRDAIYESIAASERARLHDRAGSALEVVYSADLHPQLPKIARHLFLARGVCDPARATLVCERAARSAAGQLAHEHALEFWEMAVKTHEGSGGNGEAVAVNRQRRLELLIELGEARWASGGMADSARIFERASRIARRERDGGALARIGRNHPRWYRGERQHQDHLGYLESALELLPQDDLATRAGVLADHGDLLSVVDAERGLARCDQALALAERSGDSYSIGYAQYMRTFPLWRPGTARERLAQLTVALDAAVRAGDAPLELRSRFHRAQALIELGELGAAEREMEAARRTGRYQSDNMRIHFGTWDCMIALLRGDLERAEPLVFSMHRRSSEHQSDRSEGFLAVRLGVLRAMQGRLDELDPLLEAGRDEFEALPAGRAMLAWYEVERGRPERARLLLDALAVDDFAGLPRDRHWLFAMGFVAEAVRALGDERRAEVLYQLLLPHRDEWGVFNMSAVCNGSAEHGLGLLAACMGDALRGSGHFRNALEAHEAAGVRPYVAHVQKAWGDMLLEHEPDSAVRSDSLDLLMSARDTYAALGMPGHEARAQGAIEAARPPRVRSIA